MTKLNKKKDGFKIEKGYCQYCLAVPIELNYHYVLKDDCKCSCHQKKTWEAEFEKKYCCIDSPIHYIECCEYPTGNAVKEIEKFIHTLLSQQIQELKDLLDKGKNNDYQAIGMGSLDYHEKCAIDGYIEWLKNRIKLF